MAKYCNYELKAAIVRLKNQICSHLWFTWNKRQKFWLFYTVLYSWFWKSWMSQLESDSFFQSFPAITTLLSTYTAECNKLTQVLRKLSNNFAENGYFQYCLIRQFFFPINVLVVVYKKCFQNKKMFSLLSKMINGNRKSSHLKKLKREPLLFFLNRVQTD